MNAIDLLKEQHEEVKNLFEQIEQAADDDEKLEIFQELADNLTAHATIEEKIFYPAAYAKATKELLTESVEEHLSMKRIIADLLDLPSDDDKFDAKIQVLKEQVGHHVEEEEGELFKKVLKEIDSTELEALGNEMALLFDAEMEGSPRDAVPDQTSEAAPPQ